MLHNWVQEWWPLRWNTSCSFSHAEELKHCRALSLAIHSKNFLILKKKQHLYLKVYPKGDIGQLLLPQKISISEEAHIQLLLLFYMSSSSTDSSTYNRLFTYIHNEGKISVWKRQPTNQKHFCVWLSPPCSRIQQTHSCRFKPPAVLIGQLASYRKGVLAERVGSNIFVCDHSVATCRGNPSTWNNRQDTSKTISDKPLLCSLIKWEGPHLYKYHKQLWPELAQKAFWP